MIITHIIGGIVAAALILAHILLHWKVITKGKAPAKAVLCLVLAITIGYSLFGGVRGVLHHTAPKDDVRTEQGADGDHQPKDGEKK